MGASLLPTRSLRARPRREHLVVTAIWLLGLASLGAVLVLQERLDQRRHAQITVATLRTQVSLLPKVALGLTGKLSRPEAQAELRREEQEITDTASTLDGLSGNHSDSRRIIEEVSLLFPLLDRANAVASSGHLRAATLRLGLALLPGQPGYTLNSTFDEIGGKYGREASAARTLADIGSVAAIVLLLVAFTVVLWRAARLSHEKQLLLEQSRQDALTDELTGLWNRRKLFADLDELLARPAEEPAVLGVLDLDGFKAYNDRFGHPAGDTLLARMGRGLKAAVEGGGAAYRLGGDEFCVIACGQDADSTLALARATLVERVDGLRISCSLGSARIVSGSTADEILRDADERLYDEKRSSPASRARMPLDADGHPLFAA